MSQLPIRSMTGFARLTGVAPGNTTFVVTLKSVNHRYLDLQFYLPNGMDALEILWRKTIKEHVVRGHIEVRLSLQRESAAPAPQYNPAVVKAYIEAFRAASSENKIRGVQPDLNSALRLPGVWTMEAPRAEETEQTQIELAAAAALQPAMESLNAMRAQEGRVLARRAGANSRLACRNMSTSYPRCAPACNRRRPSGSIRKCANSSATPSISIAIAFCRKPRCWRNAAISKRNWHDSAPTSTNFVGFSIKAAKSARSSTSCCRK